MQLKCLVLCVYKKSGLLIELVHIYYLLHVVCNYDIPIASGLILSSPCKNTLSFYLLGHSKC